MGIFKFFGLMRIKDSKPTKPSDSPISSDCDWRVDHYEKNIDIAVNSMRNNGRVLIFDDGRGYELALDVKRKLISDYLKGISENIHIDCGSDGNGHRIINIHFKHVF